MPVVQGFPETSAPSKSTPTKKRLRHIKRIQVINEFITSSSTTLSSELLQNLSFALYSKTEKYLDEKDREQFKTIVLRSEVKNEKTSCHKKGQKKMSTSKREYIDHSEHTFVSTVECKESILGLQKKINGKRKPFTEFHEKFSQNIKGKDQLNKSVDQKKSLRSEKAKNETPASARANASLLLESVSRPFPTLCLGQNQHLSDGSSELQFKAETKYDIGQKNFDHLADFLKKEDLRQKGLLGENNGKSSFSSSLGRPQEKIIKKPSIHCDDIKESDEEHITKFRRQNSFPNVFCDEVQANEEKRACSLGSEISSDTSDGNIRTHPSSNKSKLKESTRDGKGMDSYNNLNAEAQIAESSNINSGIVAKNKSKNSPQNSRHPLKNHLTSNKSELDKLEKKPQTARILSDINTKEDGLQSIEHPKPGSVSSSLSDVLTILSETSSCESVEQKTGNLAGKQTYQNIDIKSHRTRLADSFKDKSIHGKEKKKIKTKKDGHKHSQRREKELDKKTLGQKISLFLHKKRAETENLELIRPEVKTSEEERKVSALHKNKVIVLPKVTDRGNLNDSVETIELVTLGKNVKSEHPVKQSLEKRKPRVKDTSQSDAKLESEGQNQKADKNLRHSKGGTHSSKHHHHYHHRRHHHHHSRKNRDQKDRRRQENINADTDTLKIGKKKDSLKVNEEVNKSFDGSKDGDLDHKASHNSPDDDKEKANRALRGDNSKRQLRRQQIEDSSMELDDHKDEKTPNSKASHKNLNKDKNRSKESQMPLSEVENNENLQKTVSNTQKVDKNSEPPVGENHPRRKKSDLDNETTKSKKEKSKDLKNSKYKKSRRQKESNKSSKRVQNLEHLSAGGSFETKKRRSKEDKNSTLGLEEFRITDDINCVIMYPYRSVSQTDICDADSNVKCMTPQEKNHPEIHQNNELEIVAGINPQKLSKDLGLTIKLGNKPSQFNTVAIASYDNLAQRGNTFFGSQSKSMSGKTSRNEEDRILIASYIADGESEKLDEEIKVINYESPKEMSKISNESSREKSSEKFRNHAKSPATSVSPSTKKIQKQKEITSAEKNIPFDKKLEKSLKNLKYERNVEKNNDLVLSKNPSQNKQTKDRSGSKLATPEGRSVQIKGSKSSFRSLNSEKVNNKLLLKSFNSSFKDKMEKLDRGKHSSFKKAADKISKAQRTHSIGIPKTKTPLNNTSSHQSFATFSEQDKSCKAMKRSSKDFTNNLNRDQDPNHSAIREEKDAKDKYKTFENLSKKTDLQDKATSIMKTSCSPPLENGVSKLFSKKLDRKFIAPPRDSLPHHIKIENNCRFGVLSSSFFKRFKKRRKCESQHREVVKSPKPGKAGRIEDPTQKYRLPQCSSSRSSSSQHSEDKKHSQTRPSNTNKLHPMKRRMAVLKVSSAEAEIRALGKSSLSVIKDGRKCTCIAQSENLCTSNFTLPIENSTSLQDQSLHNAGSELEEDEDEEVLSRNLMVDFAGQTDFSNSFDSDDIEAYLPMRMRDVSTHSNSIKSKSTKEERGKSETAEKERMISCEYIGFDPDLSMFEDVNQSEVNDEGADDDSDDDDEFDLTESCPPKSDHFDKTVKKSSFRNHRASMVRKSGERRSDFKDVDTECTCVYCELGLPGVSDKGSSSKCCSSLNQSVKSLFDCSSKQQTYITGNLLIGPSIDDAILGTLQLFNQIKPKFPFSSSSYSKSRNFDSENRCSSQCDSDSSSDKSIMVNVKKQSAKNAAHRSSQLGNRIHEGARKKITKLQTTSKHN